jgi:hypothetical protein
MGKEFLIKLNREMRNRGRGKGKPYPNIILYEKVYYVVLLELKSEKVEKSTPTRSIKSVTYIMTYEYVLIYFNNRHSFCVQLPQHCIFFFSILFVCPRIKLYFYKLEYHKMSSKRL